MFLGTGVVRWALQLGAVRLALLGLLGLLVVAALVLSSWTFVSGHATGPCHAEADIYKDYHYYKYTRPGSVSFSLPSTTERMYHACTSPFTTVSKTISPSISGVTVSGSTLSGTLTAGTYVTKVTHTFTESTVGSPTLSVVYDLTIRIGSPIAIGNIAAVVVQPDEYFDYIASVCLCLLAGVAPLRVL